MVGSSEKKTHRWSIFVHDRRNLGGSILDFPKGRCVDIASWPFLTNKALLHCFQLGLCQICRQLKIYSSKDATKWLISMDFRGPLEKAQYLKDACSCSGHMVMKGAKSITICRRQSISAHLISFTIIQLVYTNTYHINSLCSPNPLSRCFCVFGQDLRLYTGMDRVQGQEDFARRCM